MNETRYNLPDDVPENIYRRGYTRVYVNDGGYYDAIPDDFARIESEVATGSAFWIVTVDLFGDPLRIKRGAVVGLGFCTPDGLARVLEYETWRRAQPAPWIE